ncbi:hypothetical protein KZZ52_20955 [Dactylosporangium sp. AC04546]|uniref:hypothetical protein n=1 Tax=Dactylosporangium sp. AC04546 TaxID=2862460 RepID=UPI001EE0736C|nr:hypothetical protein [Dactylosporangium sp. AC04546]WVK87756.1 hypothetical protein KZZ52_20955 [Dactylosporangium sp. AC04546]
MDQEFRSRLAQELAAEPEPPIGDLVGASVRQGRRLRAFRRLQTGGVAVAVFAVVALAAVAASGATGGAPGPQVAAPGVGSTGQTPTPRAYQSFDPSTKLVPWQPPAGAPATGPQVTATPEGVLELLLSLLPEGTTGAYAGNDDLLVQTYFDPGDGKSMLRVNVSKVVGSGGPPPSGEADARCRTMGLDACPGPDEGVVYRQPLDQGGEIVVRKFDDNCIQHAVVEVTRADGIRVQVNIASCLAWDGTRNPPAPPAITIQQAAGIALDPRWNVTLAKSIVDAGAARFPNLPEIA